MVHVNLQDNSRNESALTSEFRPASGFLTFISVAGVLVRESDHSVAISFVVPMHSSVFYKFENKNPTWNHGVRPAGRAGHWEVVATAATISNIVTLRFSIPGKI